MSKSIRVVVTGTGVTETLPAATPIYVLRDRARAGVADIMPRADVEPAGTLGDPAAIACHGATWWLDAPGDGVEAVEVRS